MSKLRPWEKKQPQTCRILPGADKRRLEYGGGKCPLMDPVTGSFPHLHERVCRFRSSRHLFHLSNPFSPPSASSPSNEPTQRQPSSPNTIPSHPVGGAGRQQPTPSAFKSTWKPLRRGEESSFGRCRQRAKQLPSICSFARACISNCVFGTRAMLGAPLATANLNKICRLCGFLL